MFLLIIFAFFKKKEMGFLSNFERTDFKTEDEK